MPPAVSVVIPVYNPGPSLIRCLASVRAQTLTEIEIICVDDGSTDGSGQRLDELAATEPRMRVIHTENSGWPGTPRNLGIDAATGRYVHLVDNDDVLPPYALAALHDAAEADRADVIFGRPVSDFRGVNHAIYRSDLRGVTLAQHPELAEALTPHRMFRRTFLNEHSIRFPEHRVPLEDHPFVLHAYLRARSITMLVDRPYYFYLRRAGSGRNAGDTALDIGLLRDPMRQVAAIAAPAGLAELVRRREMRLVALPRLTSASFVAADRSEQDRVIGTVRELLEILGGPGSAAANGLGLAHRRLVAALDDADRVRELVAWIRAIDLGVRADGLRWDGATLALDVTGGLTGADAIDGELGVEPADIEIALVHRDTHLSLGVTEGLAVDERGAVTGHVRIDTAALADGVWDLSARIRWEGLQLTRPLTADVVPRPQLGARGLRVYRANRAGALAMDLGQTVRSLARAAAPTAALHLDDGRLVVHLDLDVAGAQSAELSLISDSDVPQLVSLTAPLTPTPPGAVAAWPLPRETAAGTWRPYLRLTGSPAAPAAPLAWLLRFDGTWSVEAP